MDAFRACTRTEPQFFRTPNATPGCIRTALGRVFRLRVVVYHAGWRRHAAAAVFSACLLRQTHLPRISWCGRHAQLDNTRSRVCRGTYARTRAPSQRVFATYALPLPTVVFCCHCATFFALYRTFTCLYGHFVYAAFCPPAYSRTSLHVAAALPPGRFVPLDVVTLPRCLATRFLAARARAVCVAYALFILRVNTLYALRSWLPPDTHGCRARVARASLFYYQTRYRFATAHTHRCVSPANALLPFAVSRFTTPTPLRLRCRIVPDVPHHRAYLSRCLYRNVSRFYARLLFVALLPFTRFTCRCYRTTPRRRYLCYMPRLHQRALPVPAARFLRCRLRSQPLLLRLLFHQHTLFTFLVQLPFDVYHQLDTFRHAPTRCLPGTFSFLVDGFRCRGFCYIPFTRTFSLERFIRAFGLRRQFHAGLPGHDHAHSCTRTCRAWRSLRVSCRRCCVMPTHYTPRGLRCTFRAFHHRLYVRTLLYARCSGRDQFNARTVARVCVCLRSPDVLRRAFPPCVSHHWFATLNAFCQRVTLDVAFPPSCAPRTGAVTLTF